MEPINDRMTLQMKYTLTHTLAELLLMLVRHRVVTRRMAEIDLPVTKDVRMAMYRLRQALSGTGIEVKSLRDEGYFLGMENRKALFDLIRGATTIEEDLISPLPEQDNPER